MCHSRPLFFISVFSTNSYRKYWYNRSCQWLDSNQGPLVLEATALPTEPQPLPRQWIVCPWLDSNGGPLLSEASSDRDTNWALLDKSFTTQHHPRHRRCSQCDHIWQNFAPLENFKSIRRFFRVVFSIEQHFESTLANLVCYWGSCLFVKGQILKKSTGHLVTLVADVVVVVYVVCSVTRLGYFWKVFETFSLTKLTQIQFNFLGYFKNLCLYVKINFVSLGATLLRIGLLLILASGHTGRVPQEFRFSMKSFFVVSAKCENI